MLESRWNAGLARVNSIPSLQKLAQATTRNLTSSLSGDLPTYLMSRTGLEPVTP